MAPQIVNQEIESKVRTEVPLSQGLLQIETDPASITVGLGNCVIPENATVQGIRRLLDNLRSDINRVFNKHEDNISTVAAMEKLNYSEIDAIKNDFRELVKLDKDAPLKISFATDDLDATPYIAIGRTASKLVSENYIIFRLDSMTNKFKKFVINPCLIDGAPISQALEQDEATRLPKNMFLSI